MAKRILCLVLSFLLLVLYSDIALAHNREEHDADIEYVLFGIEHYKATHPLYSKKIQAIEDAAYLCVDQYNGNGKTELANLHHENIPGIPKSIEEFDFTSNFAHRNFTHRGWNVIYDASAHWPVRQQILINTVDKVLFSELRPLSWFPWLSKVIYRNDSYDKQCESFCMLLYYIHIIGDHIEADKYTSLAYLDPLAHLNDRDNPGVIPDLIQCCGVLFESQKDTYTFKAFIQELEFLKHRSNNLTSSIGGVNTEEEYSEYHQCAEELLKVLARYVPKLLRNEAFFRSSFYSVRKDSEQIQVGIQTILDLVN